MAGRCESDGGEPILRPLGWAFLATVTLAKSLAAQAPAPPPPLRVGSASASPGVGARGATVVPAAVDAGVELPVSVINGERPGDVLALIAGTHGMEYTLSSRCSGCWLDSIRGR
jgi:hypothetical protein